MRFIFIVFFYLTVGFLKGQDYLPFRLDQVSIYGERTLRSGLNYFHSYRLDTVLKRDSHEVMLLNLPNDMNVHCYIKTQKMIDSITGGYKEGFIDSIIKVGSVYKGYFIGDCYFKINVKMKPGESIDFKNFKVFCQKVDTLNFLGIVDSVKYFGFTPTEDKNSIVVSKNYGLVRFGGKKLVGIENQTFSIGIIKPKLSDFQIPKAGDKIYWKETSGSGPDYFERFSRDSIIMVNASETGFTFDIHRKSYVNDTLVYNDFQNGVHSINLNEIDLLCKTQYPSFKLPNQYEYLEFTSGFQYHTKDSFYKVSFSVNGIRLDSSNCKTDFMWDIGGVDIFDSRFPLRQIYRPVWGNNKELIIGAIIDGKSYLNPWILTHTSEIPLIHELKIYPNPAQNTLFLNHTFNTKTKVEVYSTQGQLLIQDNLSPNENSIDVSQLNNGTYVLKLVNDEGVWQKRILVKK
jgi:hypothetical protein